MCKCVHHIDPWQQYALPTSLADPDVVQQSDPLLGQVTLLAGPHQYPSFTPLH